VSAVRFRPWPPFPGSPSFVRTSDGGDSRPLRLQAQRRSLARSCAARKPSSPPCRRFDSVLGHHFPVRLHSFAPVMAGIPGHSACGRYVVRGLAAFAARKPSFPAGRLACLPAFGGSQLRCSKALLTPVSAAARPVVGRVLLTRFARAVRSCELGDSLALGSALFIPGQTMHPSSIARAFAPAHSPSQCNRGVTGRVQRRVRRCNRRDGDSVPILRGRSEPLESAGRTRDGRT
jgi:hypothetical protein